MKKILISTLLSAACYANLADIQQFEADFQQEIIDDQNKTIQYRGHIQASKPQYAKWKYIAPIEKEIYIHDNRVVIIEPELEQVLFKHLEGNHDFFSMITHAKKVAPNLYKAHFGEKSFFITTQGKVIRSISYKDEFDNAITIRFSNEKINHTIDLQLFTPEIPKDYDLIQE